MAQLCGPATGVTEHAASMLAAAPASASEILCHLCIPTPQSARFVTHLRRIDNHSLCRWGDFSMCVASRLQCRTGASRSIFIGNSSFDSEGTNAQSRSSAVLNSFWGPECAIMSSDRGEQARTTPLMGTMSIFSNKTELAGDESLCVPFWSTAFHASEACQPEKRFAIEPLL